MHSARVRTPATRSVFGMGPPGQPAPPWTTREWFGIGDAVQLADLRGKVVVLHAFQMLCPACVHHGLPQAQRIHATFAASGVAVIGLHTVFEHQAAMTPVSLQAFLHDYRIGFPVGVDSPSADASNPLPVTMEDYGMQGTPSLMLIDRNGHLRLHAFGAVEDLALGTAIANSSQKTTHSRRSGDSVSQRAARLRHDGSLRPHWSCSLGGIRGWSGSAAGLRRSDQCAVNLPFG